MNIRNFGVLQGRAVKDPKVIVNPDGSRKIYVTIAVDNNWKNKDGERTTEFISTEAFLPATKVGNGVFDYVKKGDKIGLETSLRTNNYTAKDGTKVYGFVVAIQSVDLQEAKKTVTGEAIQPEAFDVEPATEVEDLPFN